MNWITGPNRAFGVGETKSQNAVIKVYSADELKNALTKIYQLDSGIGTIEIAGDIIISEPIKLKQFKKSDSQPREIIIQAIAGASIKRSDTSVNTAKYNYNQSSNLNFPVFDFGQVPVTSYSDIPNCKYIFKNLNIGSESSNKEFGAFIAYNITSNSGYASPVIIDNIKLINTWNLIASYNINSIYINTLQVYNNSYTNIRWSNRSNNIPTFNIKTPMTYMSYSNFSYCGRLYPLESIYPGNDLNIDQEGFFSNTISSILAPITITTGTTIATNNIFMNCFIRSTDFNSGLTFIGCISELNSWQRTVFPTLSERSAVTFTSDIVGSTNKTITTTYNFHTDGAGQRINIFSGTGFGSAWPTNSYYQIDWKVCVRYTASGLTNNYHFKTTCRINGSSVPTIVSTSTIYALEEVYTTTGLTPIVDAGTKDIYINPSDTGALAFTTDSNITITGFKFIV